MAVGSPSCAIFNTGSVTSVDWISVGSMAASGKHGGAGVGSSAPLTLNSVSIQMPRAPSR